MIKLKNNQLNVLIVLKFPTSEQLSCQVQSILLKTVLTYEAFANAVVFLVCLHHGSYLTNSIKRFQFSSAAVHG
jgi:hypothetical protein